MNGTDMKRFMNKNFTRRDYECTNVVACIADVAPSADWIECDETRFTGVNMCGRRFAEPLMQLWTERGVQYWGWL